MSLANEITELGMFIGNESTMHVKMKKASARNLKIPNQWKKVPCGFLQGRRLNQNGDYSNNFEACY